MLLTICLWIFGIGVAITFLWFLFVLVTSIVQGYSEQGFWGAVTNGLVTAGMGIASLVISAFQYILTGLVILGIIWAFHSCSKPDKTIMTPEKKGELTEEVKADAMRFSDSIQFRNQARRIISPPSSTSVVYEVSEEDHALAIKLLKKALDACRNVSDTTLSLMHKDMPLHYHRQYQEGLRIYIFGLEQMDREDMLRGQKLCDDFGDWYMSEAKESK